MRALLHFDGGSRGNPGPAAYGCVLSLEGEDHEEVVAQCIGVETNNVAEYRGLIAGLERARDLGVTWLGVRGDSKLVIMQARGAWQVKSADLRPLHARAVKLALSFEHVHFEHVRREHNSAADKLVNDALDGHPVASVERVSPSPSPYAELRTTLQRALDLIDALEAR